LLRKDDQGGQVAASSRKMVEDMTLTAINCLHHKGRVVPERAGVPEECPELEGVKENGTGEKRDSILNKKNIQGGGLRLEREGRIRDFKAKRKGLVRCDNCLHGEGHFPVRWLGSMEGIGCKLLRKKARRQSLGGRFWR